MPRPASPRARGANSLLLGLVLLCDSASSQTPPTTAAPTKSPTPSYVRVFCMEAVQCQCTVLATDWAATTCGDLWTREGMHLPSNNLCYQPGLKADGDPDFQGPDGLYTGDPCTANPTANPTAIPTPIPSDSPTGELRVAVFVFAAIDFAPGSCAAEAFEAAFWLRLQPLLGVPASYVGISRL